MFLNSSVSAPSQRWMGFSLLFTHQDIFIPPSLSCIYCSRIVIRCSNKSEFYVMFCIGYLEHLLLMDSIACFFSYLSQKDLLFGYT